MLSLSPCVLFHYLYHDDLFDVRWHKLKCWVHSIWAYSSSSRVLKLQCSEAKPSCGEARESHRQGWKPIKSIVCFPVCASEEQPLPRYNILPVHSRRNSCTFLLRPSWCSRSFGCLVVSILLLEGTKIAVQGREDWWTFRVEHRPSPRRLKLQCKSSSLLLIHRKVAELACLASLPGLLQG